MKLCSIFVLPVHEQRKLMKLKCRMHINDSDRLLSLGLLRLFGA